MVLKLFPNSCIQPAVLPKWVVGFRWGEAIALLLSPQARLRKLATEILPWVVGVQTSLTSGVKGGVGHGQLSFLLLGMCLRGISPRRSLLYLSALSCVFWAGGTGLSDLCCLGIVNSEFSFYEGCACHAYLDVEKHLVCLAPTCMVYMMETVVCS